MPGDPDAEAFGAPREPDGGPPRPGTVLRQILDAAGISEGAFAKHTGIPIDNLSRILHGHRRLSVSTARRIAAATGTLAMAWLTLQCARTLWEAEVRGKLQIDIMPGLRRLRPPSSGKARPSMPPTSTAGA